MKVSLYKDIIEKIDQGVSHKKIANLYSWADLSPMDQAALFKEAEQRSETSDAPLHFLQILLYMTNKSDPWAAIKVLSFVLQVIDKSKKNDVLREMQKKLDSIGETLSKSNRTEIERYMRFQAEYYIHKAHTEIDIGNLTRAINSYQSALELYEKCGPAIADKAAIVKSELDHLHMIQSQQQHFIPQDKLESQYLQLKRELDKLKNEYLEMQKNIQRLQHQKSELQQSRDELRKAIEAYRNQKEQLGQLQEKINQHQAGLYFLTLLPQAAMAPLWVEVVRLALEQGEIDAFTEQALERLAPKFSEQAIPLLAEMAARAPEPFTTSQESYQASTSHWMAQIAQARRLKAQNNKKAASLLVEAWDTYFKALSGK